MVSLYKDPDGDTVFAAHSEALEIEATFNSQSGRQESQDEVGALKQRIKQLEDELTKHTVREV